MLDENQVNLSVDGVTSPNRPVNNDKDRWFVYDMTLAIERNRRRLVSLLGQIKDNFERIADQGECPVCFDPLQEDVGVTTLSCLHKVLFNYYYYYYCYIIIIIIIILLS